MSDFPPGCQHWFVIASDAYTHNAHSKSFNSRAQKTTHTRLHTKCYNFIKLQIYLSFRCDNKQEKRHLWAREWEQMEKHRTQNP